MLIGIIVVKGKHTLEVSQLKKKTTPLAWGLCPIKQVHLTLLVSKHLDLISLAIISCTHKYRQSVPLIECRGLSSIIFANFIKPKQANCYNYYLDGK